MGKKPKIRYRTRTILKRAKKKAGNFFSGATGQMLAAAVYGGVREKISNTLAPVTARVPAGEIADEVVMMGLNYVGSRALPKAFKAPMKAGMVIEAARIGEFVAKRGMGGIMTPTSQVQSQGGIF